MITLDQICIIGISSLLVANVLFAMFIDDYRGLRRWWRRERHYLAVCWSQMDDANRAFWRWMGRTAWLTVLVVAWVGGW